MLAISIYVLIAVSVAVNIIQGLVARDINCVHRDRPNALNPAAVISLVNCVVIMNFIALANNLSSPGGVAYFATYSLTSMSDVVGPLSFFLLLQVASLAGTIISSFIAPRTEVIDERSSERASQYTLLIAIIATSVCIAIILIESVKMGGVFNIAATRTSYFRDKQVLFLFTTVCIPAFIIYIALHPRVNISHLLLAIAVFVLLLPVGSRGSAVFIATSFLVVASYNSSKYVKYGLASAAPLVYAMAYYRYIVREVNFNSFIEFLDEKGGIIGVVFDGTEFSVAEGMTALINHAPIERSPFESILASLVAFIPRNVYPAKPWGASAHFSMVLYPERWDIVQSEWAISGYSELYLEYGPVFAPVIVAIVVAAVMCFYASRVFRSQRRLLSIVSLIANWGFVRGDSYNVALFGWRFLLVFLIYLSVQKIVRSAIAQRAVDVRSCRGSPKRN